MNKWIRLIVGSMVMGSGIAIAMKGGFGVDPMALFWEGIHLQTALSYGTINLIVSGVIIVIVFFLDREQIGIGTLINPLIVSFILDLLSSRLPASENIVIRLLLLFGGLILLAAGIAYYGSGGLGRGAYEGLFFGIADKTSLSIRMIRSLLDLMFAIMGMLLGARLSLGPVVSVLLMGNLIQFFHERLKLYEK